MCSRCACIEKRMSLVFVFVSHRNKLLMHIMVYSARTRFRTWAHVYDNRNQSVYIFGFDSIENIRWILLMPLCARVFDINKCISRRRRLADRPIKVVSTLWRNQICTTVAAVTSVKPSWVLCICIKFFLLQVFVSMNSSSHHILSHSLSRLCCVDESTD